MATERVPILADADHSDVSEGEPVVSSDLEEGGSDRDVKRKRTSKPFQTIVCVVGLVVAAVVVVAMMALVGDGLKEEIGSPMWKEADIVERVPCITSLQFSPHAECFTESFDPSGSCANFVETKVNEILNGTEFRIDFANIIYTNGHFFPMSTSWGTIHAQCPIGGPNYTEDDTIMIYNKERWNKIEGQNRTGCLGHENVMVRTAYGGWDRRSEPGMRRPYFIQAFEHKVTKKRLLVVAAHFPHRREYEQHVWMLRDDIKSLTNATNVTNILLMADTNLGGDMGSTRIFHDIGASSLDDMQSTALFSSCCLPAFRSYGYDRIVSNFGAYMENHYPFSKWDVLRWGRRNMHLPVIGSLRLNGTANDRCE